MKQSRIWQKKNSIIIKLFKVRRGLKFKENQDPVSVSNKGIKKESRLNCGIPSLVLGILYEELICLFGYVLSITMKLMLEFFKGVQCALTMKP